ncbi:MAG: glucosaminidase domain-containing protein [Prevotella sp.]|jgi:hypothetical protein|nr:glucosaminidase domain-containing protein [Prevotella sp.]
MKPICFLTFLILAISNYSYSAAFFFQPLFYHDTPLSLSPREPSKSIAGKGVKSVKQLTAFFLQKNPNCDKTRIQRLAQLYITEARIEGINSDVAFVQMCLETGFLTFRGLTKPEMHNYCGLGSIDAHRPGEWFPDEQMGVRAHIQHLQAYGTTDRLKQELVDPRYHYVNPRGQVFNIYQLGGTWTADKEYGFKLARLLYDLAQV